VTLKDAKATLRSRGLSLTKRDGEYRVTWQRRLVPEASQREREAHYTNDLDDAVRTGYAMRAELVLDRKGGDGWQGR
jgi:hypothetical protein